MLIFTFFAGPFPFFLEFPPFLSALSLQYNLVYILQCFSPFSCKPYAWLCMHIPTHRQIHFTLYLNPIVSFRLRLEKVTLLNLFSPWISSHKGSQWF